MAKARWTSVKPLDIVETMVYGTHGWTKFKSRFISWPYCRKCGLMILNNAPSLKAAKGQCPPHGW